jgi:serine/threonine protein kinase
VLLPEGLEERFEIKKLLGQGGFGIVHEVVSKKNGNTYAIKTMRLPRNLSAQEKQQAEIDVLTRVGRCLNICTLYEVFKTPGHIHMVMEACTGGTLASRLTDKGDGNYSEVSSI